MTTEHRYCITVFFSWIYIRPGTIKLIYITYNTPNDRANENIPSGKAMISRMISGPSMTSNASAWPHGVIAVLYSVSSNDSREHHQKTINFLSFVLRVFVDNLKEAGTFTFTTFHL